MVIPKSNMPAKRSDVIDADEVFLHGHRIQPKNRVIFLIFAFPVTGRAAQIQTFDETNADELCFNDRSESSLQLSCIWICDCFL